MAKQLITEEKLKEIINESIRETLNEWEWLDKFATKLGQGYQNVKNSFTNAKRSFEAGKNQQKDANKNYNEYAQFGDKENDIRAMGRGNYAKFRYQQEVERNRIADGENNISTEKTKSHPDLVNNQTQRQQQNNNGGIPNYLQHLTKEQQRQYFENIMTNLGMVNKSKNPNMPNWQPKSGKITPEMSRIKQDWIRTLPANIQYIRESKKIKRRG